MNCQNIEFYETEQFQYLLIHKNASHSIIKCIESLNPVITDKINLNKVRWTVIREPYERFIAGLKYDLQRHQLNIEDIEIKSLFNSKINNFSRVKGNVNHTASQIPYLINTHINYYVELKDLHTFLKMHFGKTEYQNIDKSNVKIDLDKNEIIKYLELDYYVYDCILNSPYLWKWQQGKIF
tara:strand:- start:304 stop:846 length:543 start_codon:yes stop_codon:yes gene_type:complete